MGYKNKTKYQKNLHQQAYDRLITMQAFGESKKDAIANGTTATKIFSHATYKTYWQQTKAFVKYINQAHPDCSSLKQARAYVQEWLQRSVDAGRSAWTVQTQAKALGKLYGISPDSKDYFHPPERHREDIIRSRLDCDHDRHFSKSNNQELIKFCKGVGARREGMTKMLGRDLRTKDQIGQEVDRLTDISRERTLTKEEQTSLRINKDALIFEKNEYFVHLKEKGGRERISPIVGPDVDAIVERIRNTPPDERVWQHIHSGADIHGYRSDYSNRIYRQYARPIEAIPYDKINQGTGRRYQSEVYHCRRDEAGRALDKRAMELASKALGHNRIEVIANNYLRGL